jgi:hypothetical protein
MVGKSLCRKTIKHEVSKKGKPMKVSLSKNNLPWSVKEGQTNESQFVEK